MDVQRSAPLEGFQPIPVEHRYTVAFQFDRAVESAVKFTVTFLEKSLDERAYRDNVRVKLAPPHTGSVVEPPVTLKVRAESVRACLTASSEIKKAARFAGRCTPISVSRCIRNADAIGTARMNPHCYHPGVLIPAPIRPA